MQNRYKLIIASMLFGFLTLGTKAQSNKPDESPKSHQLKIVISNVDKFDKNAKIYCSVFRKNDRFPILATNWFEVEVVPTNSPATLNLNIPYGKYAVLVWQDKNHNDQLDIKRSNPSEPFAMSGAKVPYTEASFANACIDFEENGQILSLVLSK
jgi:uncharacterized protein (DUF2141 family)